MGVGILGTVSDETHTAVEMVETATAKWASFVIG